jgi:hypothetical protein
MSLNMPIGIAISVRIGVVEIHLNVGILRKGSCQRRAMPVREKRV